jgi:tetratricopeptide (TPR) repeat protein
MKSKTLAIATVLTTLSLVAPAVAAKPQDIQKLLSSKQCSQCDLSNAGLVFANLTGADLSGANLTGTNLSRATLQGADLRGANLTGASLVGANLIGAKLDGANLSAADLRSAYLTGATLDGASLENTMLQGVIGLSPTAGKSGDFYRWAIDDSAHKNFAGAVENFSQALYRKPDFAEAYLGRGVARFQTGDRPGAIADAKQAEQLFTAQNNPQGIQIAQRLTQELQAPPPKQQSGGIGLGQKLLSIVGVLLQFFPF